MGRIFEGFGTKGAEVHFLQTHSRDPSEAERAFETYDRLNRAASCGRKPDIWDLDLFILQARGDGIVDQMRLLGDRVSSITVFGQAQDAFRIAKMVDGDAAAFLVNIDVIGPLEKAVDALLSLRLCNPALSVIVLSAEFVRDDTSLERSAIADCSLRLPCTPERLRDGLITAKDNTRLRRIGGMD